MKITFNKTIKTKEVLDLTPILPDKLYIFNGFEVTPVFLTEVNASLDYESEYPDMYEIWAKYPRENGKYGTAVRLKNKHGHTLMHSSTIIIEELSIAEYPYYVALTLEEIKVKHKKRMISDIKYANTQLIKIQNEIAAMQAVIDAE